MPRLLDIIFDLILVVVVARGIVSAFRRLFGPSGGSSRPEPFSSSGPQEENQTIRGKTARDPVCGMFVSTELSHRLNWHGEMLHFCSRECLEHYQKKAV